MNNVNKKRLIRLVTDFVISHGSAANDDGGLIIETTGGLLEVTPYGDYIYCRFHDVEKAKAVLPHHEWDSRLNPHSGKWNFHFGTAASPFYCLSVFEAELTPLLLHQPEPC